MLDVLFQLEEVVACPCFASCWIVSSERTGFLRQIFYKSLCKTWSTWKFSAIWGLASSGVFGQASKYISTVFMLCTPTCQHAQLFLNPFTSQYHAIYPYFLGLALTTRREWHGRPREPSIHSQCGRPDQTLRFSDLASLLLSHGSAQPRVCTMYYGLNMIIRLNKIHKLSPSGGYHSLFFH